MSQQDAQAPFPTNSPTSPGFTVPKLDTKECRCVTEPALSIIYPALEIRKHISQNINGDTGNVDRSLLGHPREVPWLGCRGANAARGFG